MSSLIELDDDTNMKFDKAFQTETPINFIYKIGDRYLSLKEELSVIPEQSFNKYIASEEESQSLNRNIASEEESQGNIDSKEDFISSNGEFLLSKYIEYTSIKKISFNDFFMVYYKSMIIPDSDTFIQNVISFTKQLKDLKLRIRNIPEDYEIEMKNTFWDSRWKRLNKDTKTKHVQLVSFYQDIKSLEQTTPTQDIQNSLNFEMIKYKYKIVPKGYKLTEETGIFLFSDSHTNNNITYIHYKSSDNDYYKTFKLAEQNFNQEYFVEQNHIYSFLRFSKDYSNIFIDIDIQENALYYEIPSSLSKEKETINSILNNTFGNITLEDETKDRITGYFDIYFRDYDENKFYMMTLLDDLMKKIIFVKDEQKLRAFKEVKYYFRDPSFIKSKSVFSEHILFFRIKPTYGGKLRIEFNSKDERILDFGILISKIANYYINTFNNPDTNISRYYNTFIKGLVQTTENLQETTEYIEQDKLKQLISRNPAGMFPKNTYVRKICACPKQPIIIDEEDVDDYNRYGYSGTAFNTTTEGGSGVTQFPNTKSTNYIKNYYLFPSHDMPYLILKKNQDKEYPFLPCCAGTLSKYDKFLLEADYKDIVDNPEDFTNTDKRIRNKYNLKTLKPLVDKATGEIPDSLNTFLRKAYPNDNPKFKRFGMPDEPHFSFIHCVMRGVIGIDSKNPIIKKYINAYIRHKMGKEFIQFFKEEILKDINLHCMSQELYEYGDNLIEAHSNMFSSSNVFGSFLGFDPRLHFRMFEILFDINIFTFVTDDINNTIPYIEIPNYINFHVRNINPNKPTIIILKHLTPFYNTNELIYAENLDRLKNKKIMIGKAEATLFDSNMTKYLNTFYQKNNYITVLRNFFGYNIYNDISWESYLKDKIISQHINSEGKCFAIDIKIINVPEKITQERGLIYTKTIVTMYIPPCPPFNERLNKDTIYISDINTLSSVFGNNYNLRQDGISYEIGNLFEVFFPCYIHSSISNNTSRNIPERFPQSVYPPFFLHKQLISEDTIYNQILDWYNITNILVSIILWIWRNEDKPKQSEFLNKFIKITKDVNFERYLVLKIKTENFRYLPSCKDGNQCIEKLKEVINLPEEYSFITDNKILINPETYDNLVLFLNFMNRRTSNSILKRELLLDIYKNNFNIKTTDLEHLFVTEENFDKWLRVNRVDKKIRLRITFDDLSAEPFIYKDKNNIIYIMQKVKDGDFETSLKLCDFWRKKRVNLGYHSDKILRKLKVDFKETLKDMKYVIYKQTREGELFVKSKNFDSKNTPEGVFYYQLYEYNSSYKGEYIAMLPLNI